VSALSTLVSGIVDYAGLYPPASLPMTEAASSYDAYRRGPEAYMLGRFVVGAARLEELGEAARPLWPDARAGSAWRISALLTDDLAADRSQVERFNAREAGRAIVDTVEGKAASVEDLDRLRTAASGGLILYVEVPLDPDPSPLLAALAVRSTRAKARTGGLSAEAVPSPAALARFLAACARLRVPFKATAGLHHPLRSLRPFTYAPDSPRGVMHGFLNVFVAAALLFAGRIDAQAAESLLREEGGDAFAFDGDRLLASGHVLEARELRTIRASFAASFGSCSFTEPVSDLRGLGLLAPEDAPATRS
jgi:hypothetical protein